MIKIGSQDYGLNYLVIVIHVPKSTYEMHQSFPC